MEKPRSYFEALPLDERLDIMAESAGGVEIECGWWATDNRASYRQMIYRISWICITDQMTAYGRTVKEAMDSAWKQFLDFEATFNGFVPETQTFDKFELAGTLQDGVLTITEVDGTAKLTVE